MNRSDIDRLGSLPIESVAERLGLRVERHKALCPFHDDSHPSLTFSVSRNRFKCFVCDAHGGVIDLAMKILGRNFVETCRWLADEHNVILETPSPLTSHPSSNSLTSHPSPFTPEKYRKFFERPFINQLAGEFLYEQRHIDPRVVRWCKLTSWKNWLQIPYYDIDGNLIGVQWRNLMCLEGTTAKRSVTGGEALGKEPKEESGWKPVPRFRFPYGSNCHIYNLPILKMLREGEELWIAEGCSDCWALLSSGHKAIAIPSATLLTPKDLEILSSLSSSLSLNLHMFPDQDLPGERLYLKLKELLPNLIRHDLPSGCKDFSDFYLSTINPKP